MVLGSFPDVCVGNVDRSVDFYRSLLGLQVLIDHGWYVELGIPGRTLLALVQRGHETVPLVAHTEPRGVLLSFEVDDAAAVATNATRMECMAIVDLVTELGQRHLMVLDPDGAVVDVIERVALGTTDLRRLATDRRQHLRATT